ncbi:uncharacterized protein BO66DRAFT_458057, partial [Aspergillus aculeatinus CBS 121060]
SGILIENAEESLNILLELRPYFAIRRHGIYPPTLVHKLLRLVVQLRGLGEHPKAVLRGDEDPTHSFPVKMRVRLSLMPPLPPEHFHRGEPVVGGVFPALEDYDQDPLVVALEGVDFYVVARGGEVVWQREACHFKGEGGLPGDLRCQIEERPGVSRQLRISRI